MRKFAAILVVMAGLPAAAQTLPPDHPAIEDAVGYSSLPLTDPVANLGRKLALRPENPLAFDPVYGYLPALLKALDIPVESQMAVFSKTSIQSLRIEPSNPRVLYFNDAVVAGWVRGGFIELASQDPVRGMIFYRLEQNPPTKPAPGAAAEPPFIRHQDCLRCHSSPVTGGVPGALLRSVFPSVSGVPVNRAPQYDTDGRTPFGRLWGGWYVTGDSGPAPHMGNLIAAGQSHPEAMLEAAPVHLDSLEGKCPPGTRLTPYSDIAALLVFQHQVRVMNLLTKASWESRIALAETGSLTAAARTALNELADGLLFAGKLRCRDPSRELRVSRKPSRRAGRAIATAALCETLASQARASKSS